MKTGYVEGRVDRLTGKQIACIFKNSNEEEAKISSNDKRYLNNHSPPYWGGVGVRLCSFEEAARRELFCIDYNPSSNIIQIHSKNREKTTKLDYIAPYRAIYIILNLF